MNYVLLQFDIIINEQSTFVLFKDFVRPIHPHTRLKV